MRIPATALLLLPFLPGCVDSCAQPERIVVPSEPECGERYFDIFLDEDASLAPTAVFEGATPDAYREDEPLGRLRADEGAGVRISGRMLMRARSSLPAPVADLEGSMNGFPSTYDDGHVLRFPRGHMWCSDGRFVGQAEELGHDLLFLAVMRRARSEETWDWGGFHAEDAGPLPDEPPAQQAADVWVLECVYDETMDFDEHIASCPPLLDGTVHRVE